MQTGLPKVISESVRKVMSECVRKVMSESVFKFDYPDSGLLVPADRSSSRI